MPGSGDAAAVAGPLGLLELLVLPSVAKRSKEFTGKSDHGTVSSSKAYTQGPRVPSSRGSPVWPYIPARPRSSPSLQMGRLEQKELSPFSARAQL